MAPRSAWEPKPDIPTEVSDSKRATYPTRETSGVKGAGTTIYERSAVMQPDEVTGKKDSSLAGLLTDFTRELSTLVRQEGQLMKAELSEKVSEAGAGVGSLTVGGAIVFAGFLTLLLAAVAALNDIMGAVAVDNPWLSPLIVGSIVLIIGLVLLQKGRSNLKAKNLMPKKSGESLRRDSEVLREHIK
ncbi:phage holin family protein [Methylocaldum sp. 14B]|uniref:phage holin family protein n=2 Tax=unclassified Methylocaldum TaxID=2622260 RepID=UPI0032046F05